MSSTVLRTALVMSLCGLTACSKPASSVTTDTNNQSSSAPPSPTATAEPTATPLPTPVPTPVPTPNSADARIQIHALWEAVRPGSRSWTIHAFDAVATDGPHLQNGSADMALFCPHYATLTPDQKISFWVYLVSAVVKYESDFDPTNRYIETTLGRDPITGSQVVSEGLMQLSYQDLLYYPFCNQFNWAADSKLSPTDPRKTILDPNINLTCGIRILNDQIRRVNLISIKSGAYWSTLEPGTSAAVGIEALTKEPSNNNLDSCAPLDFGKNRGARRSRSRATAPTSNEEFCQKTKHNCPSYY